MLTPSKQQLRHREVRWGGSWTAKHCTDEQKPRRRQIEVGQRANERKARHRRQLRDVDVAAVVGKSLFLSGEICIGVTGRRDERKRKNASAGAEVSRGRSSGEGAEVRHEGPNIKRMNWTSQLVLRAATAANPGVGAWSGRRR